MGVCRYCIQEAWVDWDGVWNWNWVVVDERQVLTDRIELVFRQQAMNSTQRSKSRSRIFVIVKVIL